MAAGPACRPVPLPDRRRPGPGRPSHLLAWLAVGGAWAGPVSFRKPTTFGLSFGLTTITLAWITGRLRLADRTRWLLLGPLALANTYEVVWVSTQRWRGVASRFNQDTTLDYALFLLGAAAIAVTVTVIVALTVLAFSAMQAPPSMALAIRAAWGPCWSPRGSAAG